MSPDESGGIKRAYWDLSDSSASRISRSFASSMSQTLPKFPYEHYAMVYIDHQGIVRVRESPSVQNSKSGVFTTNLRREFLEIIAENPSNSTTNRMETSTCI